MKEKWKPIEGYEGLYEVSTFGNVRNMNGALLYQEEHNKGYLRVKLIKDGKRKNHKVHRLVAKAFLPNPYGKPCINHRDFNVQNNRVWNLEWVTDEENRAWSKMWRH